MHLSGPEAFGQSGLAIRALGNLESVLGDSLVDERGPATSSAGGATYQLSTAEQLLRFVNCAEGFQGRELSILMRTMQHTKVPDRLPWFQDIRSCRRRAQRPHQQLPIAALFLKADRLDDLAVHAFVSRLRWAFAEQRLSPADVFGKLDTDNDGTINLVEFQMGLEWFGLNKVTSDQRQWKQQVDRVFNAISE